MTVGDNDSGRSVHWLMLAWTLPLILGFSGIPGASSYAQSVIVSLFVLIAWVFILWRGGSSQRVDLAIAEITLFGFGFLVLISSIVASSPPGSYVHGLWWLESLVFYLLLVTCISHEKSKNIFFWSVQIFGLLGATSLILNKFTLAWTEWMWPFRLFYSDLNSHALLLLLPFFSALAMLVKKNRNLQRLLSILALILYGVAIYLADARALMLGIGIGTGAFLLTLVLRYLGARLDLRYLTKAERLVSVVTWLLLILSVLSLLTTIHIWGEQAAQMLDESMGGRIRRWMNGMVLVRENLPSGIGSGNWNLLYENYRHQAIPDAGGLDYSYNYYLLLLAEGGWLLLPVFIIAISVVLSAHGNNIQLQAAKSTILAFLVYLSFQPPFLYQQGVFIFAVILAFTRVHENPSTPIIRFQLTKIKAGIVSLLLLSGLIYQTIVARADAIAMVIASKIDFSSSEAKYQFTPRSAKLANFLLGSAPSNDYRQLTPDRLGIISYASHRYRDIQGKISRDQALAGSCSTAEKWANAATNSNSQDGEAAYAKCLCHDAENESVTTEASCADLIRFRSGHFDTYLTYAQQLFSSNKAEKALDALDQAESLLNIRFGTHEFGYASIRRIDGYVKARRLIHALRNTALTQLSTKASQNQLSGGVLTVPEIHKRIAVSRQEVYFSSNESGRFELWHVPRDGGTARWANHSHLDPFQLSISPSGRNLYFLSDNWGNGNYQLYQFNPSMATVKRLVNLNPEERIGDYTLSPNGYFIAYTVAKGSYETLHLYNVVTGIAKQLPSRFRFFDRLSWKPDEAAFAYVSNGNRIYEYSLARETISPIGFAQKVNPFQIVYPSRGPGVIILSEDQYESVAIDWLRGDSSMELSGNVIPGKPISLTAIADNQFLVRFFTRDEYLLGVWNTSSNSFQQVGPKNGVVYPLSISPSRKDAYFLHADTEHPTRLAKLSLQTFEWETIPGFLQPTSYPAANRITKITSVDNPSGVPIYAITPRTTGDLQGTVVWLHGARGSYSPRWHKYAEYFSRNKFLFVAINYSGSTGQTRPDLNQQELVLQQLEEINKALKYINENFEGLPNRVLLLGVSQGSKIAREFAAKYPDKIRALAEYASIVGGSPVPNTIPRLVFVGENDVFANLETLKAKFKHNANDGSALVVLKNEGHDLRDRQNILERAKRTLDFFRQKAKGAD